MSRVTALAPRLVGTSWERILSRLDEASGRGAIVGPHGHGKSTLMRALGERLEQRGLRVRRLSLNASCPRLAPGFREALSASLCARDAVLFDGSERLGRGGWRAFCRATRACGVLVITAHRRGRLPTLHRCRTSSALLAELVSEIGVRDELTDTELTRIYRDARGDLRRALFALYDRWGETRIRDARPTR